MQDIAELLSGLTVAINVVVHKGTVPAREVRQVDAGPSLPSCRILKWHH